MLPWGTEFCLGELNFVLGSWTLPLRLVLLGKLDFKM
jgi:hypothetical protein